MNWTDIETKLPQESGVYSISVSRQSQNSQYVFTYVAHYDRENNKWHKYDPFIDESIREEITDNVLGWIENSSSYLGGAPPLPSVL